MAVGGGSFDEDGSGCDRGLKILLACLYNVDFLCNIFYNLSSHEMGLY